MNTKKHRITAICTAAVLTLGVTGCAKNQIPEMTDAEMQLIGEYVAITMKKYDAYHRSRLVDLSADIDNADSLLEDSEGGGQSSPSSVSGTPEPTADPTVEQPPENDAVAEDSYTMEEVLEFPEGVIVAYTGERLCSSYPDDEENNFFSLDAKEGRELLVLSFSISNTTQQEQEINILGSGAIFQINVDGEYSRRALTTMLGDDMSTYRNALPAGESAEAVLIIEVEQERAENISSIVLNVKNEEKTHTIQLYSREQ